jgi:predicted hydrocarbon binding protein
MESFTKMKDELTMNSDFGLVLGSVNMILMPRWFFVAIMEQVESRVGEDVAREIFYKASFEGGAKWAKVQITEAGLNGRSVIEQYNKSGSLRGWGNIETLSLDENRGKGTFRVYHSAVAEERGLTGKMVCYHLPGGLAGAFQTILNLSGKDIVVASREVKCISKGDRYCEISIEPM